MAVNSGENRGIVAGVATKIPDLSVVSGLAPDDKFNGNTVSDIQSAYQTYLSGSPVGRGGQYAQSAQQQYGYASLQDAAAAYLQAAGIPFVSSIANSIAGSGQGATSSPDSPPTASGVTTPPASNGNGDSTYGDLNDQIASEFQTLEQAFSSGFGTGLYEPPLEDQYYSDSVPESDVVEDEGTVDGTTSVPPSDTTASQSSTGGISLTMIFVLGVIIIGGYFAYKHFRKKKEG